MLNRIFIFIFMGIGLGVYAHARENLTVQDIQVGAEDNRTRIGFKLTKAISLFTVEKKENNQIIVSAPEDTFWKIPTSRTVDQGGFISYSLTNISEGPRKCIISVKPYTTIAKTSLQKQGKDSLFVIDMITDLPPPPIATPTPPPAPAPVIEVQSPSVVVNPVFQLAQTIKAALSSPQIQKIKVTAKEDGTTWLTLTATQEAYFDFQVLKNDQKIQIYLPKTNWMEVDTQTRSAGCIETYTVDDNQPNYALLILNVAGACDVIDQFISKNADGTYDFTLVMAPRAATSLETQRLQEKKLEAQARILQQPKIQLETLTIPPMTMQSGPETPAQTDTSAEELSPSTEPARDLFKELPSSEEVPSSTSESSPEQEEALFIPSPLLPTEEPTEKGNMNSPPLPEAADSSEATRAEENLFDTESTPSSSPALSPEPEPQ